VRVGTGVVGSAVTDVVVVAGVVPVPVVRVVPGVASAATAHPAVPGSVTEAHGEHSHDEQDEEPVLLDEPHHGGLLSYSEDRSTAPCARPASLVWLQTGAVA
jgi:hypothetical protein